MLETFDCAISLGPTCKTGYQIRRVFGRGRCLPSVFDRQVTPLATITHAFETGFVGMFEREELSADGNITHRRLGSSSMHGFGNDRDARYDEMRTEHDRLCRLMRRTLIGRRKLLFVIETNDYAALDLIAASIALYRDKSTFHILAVFDEGLQTWKGNNDAWDTALQSFDVRRSVECTVREWRRRAQKHMFGRYDAF